MGLYPKIIDVRTTGTLAQLTASCLAFAVGLSTKKYQLVSVGCHFSGPVTTSVRVKKDSRKGTAYDTIYDRQDLVNNQDYLWLPDGQLLMNTNEDIVVSAGMVSSSVAVEVTFIPL